MNPNYRPSPDHTYAESVLIGRSLQNQMSHELEMHVLQMEMMEEHVTKNGMTGEEKDALFERLGREFIASWDALDALRHRYIMEPLDLTFTLERAGLVELWNEVHSVPPPKLDADVLARILQRIHQASWPDEQLREAPVVLSNLDFSDEENDQWVALLGQQVAEP